MISMTTRVSVREASAEQIADFMINCDDEQYHSWWPEAHFRFHTVTRFPGVVGSLVYYDEMVGKRRLRFQAVITEFESGKRIVWQMKALVKLPAWLSLDFETGPDGLTIVHTLSVGFEKIGRVFDPLIRIYLNRTFEEDLKVHCHTEFTKLARLLHTHRF